MATMAMRQPDSFPSRVREWSGSYLRECNGPAVWAGVTTFIWYAVGLVPVQIAVTGQFGLSGPEVSSWIFIIWATGAVASIALSLTYRQPIPITSTIPGLIFLGSMAGQYSFPELIGANLMAGILILLFGITGLGGRILRWLPMPLAMGMLAGSILGDVTHMVSATVQDITIAGVTVAGFALGRLLRNHRVPPVGLAMLTGGLAVLVTQRANPVPLSWELPSLVVPHVAFSLPALIAVSLPLVVLSMGLGNVQGLGFLVSQGYRVPVNRVTVILGINSIVNAIFGGHTAIVSRNGMPIMAGPEAGPVEGRYWANLVSAALTLLIALAAGPVASLLGILPSAYIVALAGLALLASLQNALEKAFEAKLRFGALVAFVVAATTFSFMGIGSAFWALLIALGASLVGERQELLAHWRGDNERAAPPVVEERAETPRVPVTVRPTKVLLMTCSGKLRTLSSLIVNLSSEGMRIRGDQKIFLGDRLELSFSLPGGAELKLRALVRNVEQVQHDPTELWEAGCAFEDGYDQAREAIMHFVHAHQRMVEPKQPTLFRPFSDVTARAA